MDEQGEKIKNFMDTLTKSLNGLKEADEKRDEEIRTIKNDLENVKTLIPKVKKKKKKKKKKKEIWMKVFYKNIFFNDYYLFE